MALGQILREARESKGMTIAQAAEATRILYPVIEGLEAEDFRKIAAPIYGRGFIKIYAEVLDLDPGPLLDDYVELQAGGGKVKTFSRPAPLLPPKPVPIPQESSTDEQPAVAEEPTPLVTDEPDTSEAFFLAPEEQPVTPRRKNYSFVADNQRTAVEQQAQPPERNWLFSRDKTKPIFSKPTVKQPRQRIQLPKIKLPAIRLPRIQIPEGLKTSLMEIKWPVLTPPMKKALVFVSAIIGLLLIIAGLRLAFKPTPTAVTTEKKAPAVQLETHVKALRIPMPDPYID